jgi:hypothetical protein
MLFNIILLYCGFFIIVLDLRLTKIELGNSGELPLSILNGAGYPANGKDVSFR